MQILLPSANVCFSPYDWPQHDEQSKVFQGILLYRAQSLINAITSRYVGFWQRREPWTVIYRLGCFDGINKLAETKLRLCVWHGLLMSGTLKVDKWQVITPKSSCFPLSTKHVSFMPMNSINAMSNGTEIKWELTWMIYQPGNQCDWMIHHPP